MEYQESEFNEFGIKETQAENLPEGWVWQQYDDGSGHLKSPDGTDYFSYDWTTGEYKTTREDKHYDFFLDENYLTGGYSIGSFIEFKKFAEKWIDKNILKNEKTSVRDLLENKRAQNSLSNENVTQSVKENQILK